MKTTLPQIKLDYNKQGQVFMVLCDPNGKELARHHLEGIDYSGMTDEEITQNQLFLHSRMVELSGSRIRYTYIERK
jgi:hypothetical protein